VVFGPGKPRVVSLRLRWKDPESLRSHERLYAGPLVLEPDAASAKLLVGTKRWEIPIDGTLRAWTWRRYFDEYKWHLAIALTILLLVIYLIGRMIAAKFPPKARIHYVEVGQAFESDSLVKRYAKHGAFRSARFKFPLGKNARPLVWFQSTGAGFDVIPEKGTPITVLDDTLPDDQRHKTTPFRGTWDQRYRLGDRWDVELTRSAKEGAS
jgi:hypothetical protein